MADKQMQKGKLNPPNARQLGIGIAFVIVLIILLWQVWGLFESTSPTPPPKPTTATTTVRATPPPGGAEVPLTTEEHPAELMRGKITNEPSFIKMQKVT